MTDNDNQVSMLQKRVETLEAKCQKLEVTLAETRGRTATTTKWLGVVGVLMAGFLGFNTFWKLPRAIAELDVSKGKRQVEQIRDRVQEELLPQIEKDASEANRKLEELKTAEVERATIVENIRRIIRADRPFSVQGRTKNGEFVKVPWGTTDDWNILLSPVKVGLWEGTIGHNVDNALLEVRANAVAEGTGGWRIEAVDSYHVSTSEDGIRRDRAIEVNYILIPSGGAR